MTASPVDDGNTETPPPTDELDKMPQFILDDFRSMVWALEEDGKYGLVASRDPYQYIRRSIEEIRAVPGQYKPIFDRQPRNGDWLSAKRSQIRR